jgi:hypothetical protein
MRPVVSFLRMRLIWERGIPPHRKVYLAHLCTFVGRRTTEEYTPEKLEANSGAAITPWGTKEVSIPNYEVLVDLTPRLPITTVQTNGVSIPTNAFVGGYEINGDKL